jgi:cell pole-organizing protein PopZ
MTQPAKSQEPSMEEILASIRRIIADDDATKSAPKPAEVAKAAPAPTRPAPPPRPPSPPPRVPDPSLDSTVEAANPGPGAAADHSADILDLTESMASAMSPPAPSPEPHPEPSPMPNSAFRTIDGSFDVSYEEAAERPAPQRHLGEASSQLLSGATSAAVDSAFNTLAQTVLVQNARTLEDLVREMLRPMLKSWLDDNLPGLVERLVRAEIERVSRGRMG